MRRRNWNRRNPVCWFRQVCLGRVQQTDPHAQRNRAEYDKTYFAAWHGRYPRKRFASWYHREPSAKLLRSPAGANHTRTVDRSAGFAPEQAQESTLPATAPTCHAPLQTAHETCYIRAVVQASTRSSAAVVAASRRAPGGRISAHWSAPRRRSTSLRMAMPNPSWNSKRMSGTYG